MSPLLYPSPSPSTPCLSPRHPPRLSPPPLSSSTPPLLTHPRNPLACAVALSALAVLTDEQLAPRAAALGTLFRSSVRALNSPLVKEVRGRGLLNAIEIDEEKTGGRTAWQFCLLLKSRGVLAKPTHGNM
jgi:ornithine--oxo-acid transaminase